jgi:hypothetical protein
MSVCSITGLVCGYPGDAVGGCAEWSEDCQHQLFVPVALPPAPWCEVGQRKCHTLRHMVGPCGHCPLVSED